MHDLGSSETVHLITPTAIQTLPVDNFADLVRTQAGVVANGEELHVRGGRAGELDEVVDGVTLNDPLTRGRMDIPVLALSSVELIDGGQDAEYGGALAGVLQLRTENPGERWSSSWRYSTDAGLDTHYDQLSLRAGGPLHLGGLGIVAAGDLSGDDTWLPTTRTNHQTSLLGVTFGWRTENHELGWLKLAPVDDPQRGSLQVFASRELRQPWDPAWTQQGWFTPCSDPESCGRPGWSDTPPPPTPGVTWTPYKAADHIAVTDDRRLGTVLSVARSSAARRTTMSLGWIHDHEVHSPSGQPGDAYLLDGGAAFLGQQGVWGNPWYVYFGDDPLYRERRSDQLSLRADQTWQSSADRTARAGVGLTWDNVLLRELDATEFGQRLDSLRTFHAQAPGGFAYAQMRWRFQGLLLNAGARAQLFTPGGDATTVVGSSPRHAQLSLSPRLGVAYPLSTRDVFSLAYVRLQQDPAREFLYDNRTLTTDRAPLGNPALEPSTAISYQGAVKHLFSSTWAGQLGVFYRDVFGQVGARNLAVVPGAYELQYTNQDEAHALGFEASLLHESEHHRAELHYTWMQAYGSESQPEGDPYGLLTGPRTPPIDDRPLSWDRRHGLAFSGFWPLFERWKFAWSSTVSSALPWTPKVRRQLFTDPGLVNSERLDWDENTDVSVRWDPPILPIPLTFGLEVRNLFDHQIDRVATLDGYPHALINTVYDDYGAYRTENGLDGGAYWDASANAWVPVHDPRLLTPPRRIRVSLGARW